MPHASPFCRRMSAVFVCSLTCLLLAGCPKKPPVEAVNFGQALPPGQLALRKISPGEYPEFTIDAAAKPNLLRSIDNSLAYLEQPSSNAFFPYLDISHERAVASLKALREMIATDQSTASPIHLPIAQSFEVYKSIGAPRSDGSGFTDRVLFTGYFTPIYDASLTRQGDYQFPLYKRPADLVVDQFTLQTIGRNGQNGKMEPAYTRAEIERGDKLAGQELVWLKDRWDAYVITVQGSARLKLSDGRIYEVGYAGTNGYDYTSPGQQMLSDGVITQDQLTLKGLRAYFVSHPADMDKYLAINKRYVFFTERPGGPFGSLNVSVTPMATIATDKGVYPRAMPAFLTVPVPVNGGGQTANFRGFMMDQDTGGAIRAAGRCDIYMGVGPDAEALAGHQLHEGALYYVAIKPELIGKYAGAAATQP